MQPGDKGINIVDGEAEGLPQGECVGRHVRAFQQDRADIGRHCQ